MKKLMALICTFVLVLACCGGLMGCGTNRPSDINELEDDMSEHVTLKWYAIYNGQSGGPSDYKKIVEPKINEILTEELNAEIDMVFINTGSYSGEMNTKIMSSEEFDICYTSTWTNDIFTGIRQEAYWGLDQETFKTLVPDAWAQFDEEYWELSEINGKYYNVLAKQHLPRQAAMMIKQSAYDSYMAANPSAEPLQNADGTGKALNSIADVTPFLEWCAQENPDSRVLPTVDTTNVMRYIGIENLISYDIPAGVRISDTQDGGIEVFNQFDSQEFKDYCAVTRGWSEAGVWKSDIVATPAPASQIVANFPGTNKPGIEYEEKKSFNGSDVFAVTFGDYYLSSNYIFSGNSVSATSKNPIRAYKVLNEFVKNKELFNLLLWGVEGTHYEKVDENTVSVSDEQAAKYYMHMGWAFGNEFNSWLEESQPADLWEKCEENNESAKETPTFGFFFDISNVRNELRNCRAVFEEYFLQLIHATGLNESAWNAKHAEFIEKLAQAGSEKILAEAQTQLNAWLAEQ